jgi:HK97 family phage major capsid protein
MRALGTGAGPVGAFAIPFTLDPSILLTSNGALNPWREISRVINIATKEWKGVSSDGVVAAYVAEASEATDASPTLAQPSITSHQGRAFVPFSIEVSKDWTGLQDELLTLIADARDVLDATKFLTGTGTNEPAGILTGLTTAQRVQTNAVATFVLGDVWLLKAAIPARFAASSTFAANPATYDTIYRFTGGNSAEPLLMPTREGGVVGRPKVEASAMATGSTTGTKLIVAGDFRRGFTIVDRLGMTAELIPHLFGPTNRFPLGQRGLYTYWRSGSAVVAPNALRYLEVK